MGESNGDSVKSFAYCPACEDFSEIRVTHSCPTCVESHVDLECLVCGRRFYAVSRDILKKDDASVLTNNGKVEP